MGLYVIFYLYTFTYKALLSIYLLYYYLTFSLWCHVYLNHFFVFFFFSFHIVFMVDIQSSIMPCHHNRNKKKTPALNRKIHPDDILVAQLRYIICRKEIKRRQTIIMGKIFLFTLFFYYYQNIYLTDIYIHYTLYKYVIFLKKICFY